MRRHPTPGYALTLSLMQDHADVIVHDIPNGDNPPRAAMPSLESGRRMARKIGCTLEPSVVFPGTWDLCCGICGVFGDPTVATHCDPEKHRAYYDALEAGEREPIKGDDHVHGPDA